MKVWPPGAYSPTSRNREATQHRPCPRLLCPSTLITRQAAEAGFQPSQWDARGRRPLGQLSTCVSNLPLAFSSWLLKSPWVRLAGGSWQAHRDFSCHLLPASVGWEFP